MFCGRIARWITSEFGGGGGDEDFSAFLPRFLDLRRDFLEPCLGVRNDSLAYLTLSTFLWGMLVFDRGDMLGEQFETILMAGTAGSIFVLVKAVTS